MNKEWRKATSPFYEKLMKGILEECEKNGITEYEFPFSLSHIKEEK
jgi:hypothetical protein